MRAATVTFALIFAALLAVLSDFTCHGFSAASSSSSSSTIPSRQNPDTNAIDNNILILDHLNINHQNGRHDWLKAFYVDFLQCALDPRKLENVKAGQKTVWANIGAHQFHLPEGTPEAQVLDGVVTLVYPSLDALWSRYDDNDASSPRASLKGSKFHVEKRTGDNSLLVTDPWGSRFRLMEGKEDDKDDRGTQPGDESEGFAMADLTIHVPSDANLAGIGRFYEQILGSKVATLDQNRIQIEMGPMQTLTFVPKPSIAVDTHVDLREEEQDENDERMPKDCPEFLGNCGIHISLYVADLPGSYQKAEDLGVAYVNTRFSRRAYTLEQAVDDCMFRILSIVDPENVEAGPILQLEHEVRSVIKRDGEKYKSCPFDIVPEGCVTLSL